jgi:CoA:oxalate CoA-transferase
MQSSTCETPSRDALGQIRVLDFTAMIAGPYCTRWLADLGADVIKVEPLEGDYIRARAPLRSGASAYFGHLNAGKRSIALDLKKPDATSIARRLAGACDVVVENFRPGVMQRLGLDYATLSSLNPRLVYCSISGYGQAGPDASRPAFAQMVHAASGFEMANLAYQDGRDRPPNIGIFVADVLAASFATMGIQTALLHRERTGTGQFVDVTLMESMLNMLVYECQEAQFPAQKRRPVYRPSRASDGFIIIAAVNQNNFERMFEAIGHPEWKSDARFATDAGRQANWDELFDLVELWTSQRPAETCESLLREAGVPCSRYRTVAEALASPHLRQRGSFATVRDAAGDFLVPNPPFKLSAADAMVRPRVPSLGADTPALLSELLAMDEAEIRRLQEAGVVA